MPTILLISGFKLKVFSTIDSQGVLRLPDKNILVRCKIFRVNISNHQSEKTIFLLYNFYIGLIKSKTNKIFNNVYISNNSISI